MLVIERVSSRCEIEVVHPRTKLLQPTGVEAIAEIVGQCSSQNSSPRRIAEARSYEDQCEKMGPKASRYFRIASTLLMFMGLRQSLSKSSRHTYGICWRTFRWIDMFTELPRRVRPSLKRPPQPDGVARAEAIVESETKRNGSKFLRIPSISTKDIRRPKLA